MNHWYRAFIFAIALFLCYVFVGLFNELWAQGEVMIFSVIGDVPYSSSELPLLQQHINNHNTYSPSLFLLHVGDIKSGSGACSESVYSNVANILKTSEVPVFIIPGDNEWGDCSNPSQAWNLWAQYYIEFDQNFCGTPSVERQSGRQENVTFVLKGMLFIAINIPNQTESGYQSRLQDDANWVTQQLQQKASQVRGAVVFGHAGPSSSRNTLFFNPFRQAASAFGKPVLYMQGDGHKWIQDTPWPEPNMMRVQVDRGDKPPVQVTASLSPSNMFSFNRTPWGPGSQPFDRPPCGDPVPAITAAPASHNYGDVVVGNSGVKTFVVSNTGTVTLSVTNTSLVTGDLGQFNIDSGGGSFNLNPSATRNVVVSFNPTSLGAKTTTLRFQSNDPDDNPLDVGLSGNGVTPPPAPTISSFTPNNGPVGTVVTITGTSFTGASQVTFNGAAGSFTVPSSTEIRATVPSGATDGLIAVTTPGGNATSATAFDVTALPSGTTFNPIADSYTKSSDVTGNFGTATALRVKGSGPTQIAMFKFVVSGIEGSAQSAKLRVNVTQAGADGGGAYLVSNNYVGTSTPWTETGINYGNAPTVGGSPLSSVGAVTVGQWVEFTVTSVIIGDGTYSFAVKNSISAAVFYSSKEGANPPQLVVIGGGAPPPAPTISNFAPVGGPVGTEITITGSNLSGTSSVKFNGVSASGFSVDSNSQVRAPVPSAATDGPISITTPGGTVASADDFDVTPPPAPSITTFTPTSGQIGTNVTISGSNFTGATQVTFNGTSASGFVVASDTQIRVAVPSPATDGPIGVTTPGGVAFSPTDFDVTPPPAPSITTFTPTSGQIGTNVTISGSNFTGATQVTFNGTTASGFIVASDTQIRVAVPSGATDGPIGVTTPGGVALSSTDFDVTPPPVPSIASFNPGSGPVGTTVTVIGANLTGATEVSFNGTVASNFTVASDSEVRAVVPTGATDGLISVTTPGGNATSATAFDVTAPPPTTVFNPTDDAYVRLSSPTGNSGTSNTLRVRKTTSETINSYLKFNITGLAGPVQNAKLRLYVTDDGDDGGTVYSVSNNYEGTATPWVETGLIWNNAPLISGTPLSSAGAAVLNSWVELDVTPAISGDGLYSFGITNNSSAVVFYSSKEDANDPELVITISSALAKIDQTENVNPAMPEQVEVESDTTPLPEIVTLSQSYPNPFNLETTIPFSLPRASEVQLRIYNDRGQLIRTIVDGVLQAGNKNLIWNGRDGRGIEVSSGVYFVRLEVGSEVFIHRITLQK